MSVPDYDIKQSNGEVPLMVKIWGLLSTPLLPLLPGPFWPGVVGHERVISMGQTELNCVRMLNWIAWNKTALAFKLRTYAELKCLKRKWFCMLNWIVWNRIVVDIETVLTLNWIVWNRTVLTFNCLKTKTILNWIVGMRTVWLNWIAWNRNVFDN